jgi:hypothetical protein
MEVTMTEPDSTEQENPRLQSDAALILCEGRATFGRKLLTGIVAIIVVLGTLYGILHQRGETPRSRMMAVSSAVLPDTMGQAK